MFLQLLRLHLYWGLPSDPLCESHKCEPFVFSVFFICDIMNDICHIITPLLCDSQVGSATQHPSENIESPAEGATLDPSSPRPVPIPASDMLSIHQFLEIHHIMYC